MYSACVSARSVLALTRGPEPWSPFWRPKGSGADATAKVDMIVEEIERRFDSESIYRSFYRYAVDLLFRPDLGFGWHICTVDGCGEMIGRDDPSRPVPVCHTHGDTPMRPIVWNDLQSGGSKTK
jgi:hypothetical protein